MKFYYALYSDNVYDGRVCFLGGAVIADSFEAAKEKVERRAMETTGEPGWTKTQVLLFDPEEGPSIE